MRAALASSDRLHRCSHDLENYARVEDEFGQHRYFDPILESPPTTGLPGFVVVSIVSGRSADGSNFPGSEDQLFRFAENLRLEARYDEGAHEYRRFLSYYPGSPLVSAATVGLFDTEYQRGRYADAIRLRDQAVQVGHLTAADSEVLTFWAGAALLRAGNTKRARTLFTPLFDSADQALSTRARLLDAMTYAVDDQWSDAADRFAQVESRVAMAGTTVKLSDIARRGMKLPRKAPLVAGFLAVIPGLGYLYDGYSQSAFSAALVNGLFFAATYRAFKSDNNSLGAILTAFSIGWYGGNVYGSVLSAERRNAKARRDHLDRFNLGFDY